MTSKVIQGDAIETMRDLPAASVDACITDPPYGTTACAWDSVIPFAPMWAELKRVVKPKGAIVLFGSQPFSSALVMSNPKLFRYDWIWEKAHATGHLNAKKMPMRAHESVLVFYQTLPTYNPQMTNGHVRKVAVKRYDNTDVYGEQKFDALPYDSTERYPRTVLPFASDKQVSALHGTQKPVDLLRYLIHTYTNPGDMVLDFTCGSGTTGVACALEGRDFIGIEKKPKYVEIAERRIGEALQRNTLFASA